MSKNQFFREEPWGRLVYDSQLDEFTAFVKRGEETIPSSPIGIGWLVTQRCNHRCIHCYGNSEGLPHELLSTRECLDIAQSIIESRIMRVTLSGGEPMLREDVHIIAQKLKDNNINVLLGTNGTLIDTNNVALLSRYTRVEISLDSPSSDLHRRIRPMRSGLRSSWATVISAIKTCVSYGIKIRVLTTLNSWNQHYIVDIGRLLRDLGVKEWRLSWTIPVGSAYYIYETLRPQKDIIQKNLQRTMELYSGYIDIKYSSHTLDINKYFCSILPNGYIATGDTTVGKKIPLEPFTPKTISRVWNEKNYNLRQHFQKWVGSRIEFL